MCFQKWCQKTDHKLSSGPSTLRNVVGPDIISTYDFGPFLSFFLLFGWTIISIVVTCLPPPPPRNGWAHYSWAELYQQSKVKTSFLFAFCFFVTIFLFGLLAKEEQTKKFSLIRKNKNIWTRKHIQTSKESIVLLWQKTRYTENYPNLRNNKQKHNPKI